MIRRRRSSPTPQVPGQSRPAPDPVQAAEEAVSAVWIGELLAAVHDAETAVKACLHLRHRTLAVLQSAQRTGDLSLIVQAQNALEVAQHDLADSIAAWDGVRDMLARERADRPPQEWLRLLKLQQHR